jgi:periplasmic divalent cation tolerance protein
MEPIVVLTTLPDAETAASIARTLVEKRLAACVNILAPCTSVYRWRGSIESANEVPLLIKTEDGRYPALEAELLRLHPYKLPEIVSLPIVKGSRDYLTWIAGETLVDDLG